jgi:hypothetical protein
MRSGIAITEERERPEAAVMVTDLAMILEKPGNLLREGDRGVDWQ